MMSKKAILGVVGVVVLGAGLFIGYNGMVLSSVKDITQQKVGEFEAKLPPFLKTSHTETAGALVSTGTYNIDYTDPETQKISTLKFNYTMNHGVAYYLLGRLSVHTTAELTGEATALLGYKPYNFTADSIVKTTGNMSTTFNFPQATLTDGQVSTTLSNSTYNVTYDQKSEYMTSVFHMDNLKMRDPQMTALAKDIKFGYNSYLDPLKGADVTFNIAAFDAMSPAGPMVANNLSFLTKLTSDANNFSTTTNFKVGSLAVATEKDAGFELQYSLNHIHKPSAMYFVNMVQNPDLFMEKSSEVVQTEVRKQFLDALQHGITLSLDKLYVKGSMGVVDVSLNATLDKSSSVADMSFAKKLNLKSDVGVSGDITILAKAGLAGMNLIPVEVLNSDAKDMKLKLQFNNGSFLVNGVLNPTMSIQLKSILEQLDMGLQSSLRVTSY